jgi:N-acetylmuramoyl-L-alanine amidase
MLVCIDPGHGGTDPGAVAEGVREADVVLDYARALEAALKPIGTTVIMTREDDVAVDLGMRCRIANDVSADAFISLHCNASPNARAEGVQVFHAAVSTRGKALARAIFDRIAAAEPQTGNWAGIFPDGSVHTGYTWEASEFTATLPADLPWAERDRRVRERFGDRAYRTLYVLRGTRMPAVLIELGFLTSPVDRERLTDPWRCGLVARAIADGVVDWLGRGVWQPA